MPKPKARTCLPIFGTRATDGDDHSTCLGDRLWRYVPDVPELRQPLVTVVPLQLLACHTAVLRGCDVDKPRNPAKAVTVEQVGAQVARILVADHVPVKTFRDRRYHPSIRKPMRDGTLGCGP